MARRRWRTELDELRDDTRSGAAEIESRAVAVLQGAVADLVPVDVASYRQALLRVGRQVLGAQPAMAGLFRLVNDMLWACHAQPHAEAMRTAALAFLADHYTRGQEALDRLAAHAVRHLAHYPVIMTYSRSSTVVRSLLRLAQERRDHRVICSESRPGLEGQLLAMEVGGAGVPVTIGTDMALFGWLDEANALVVGADSVAGEGVVNKVGTRALFREAAERDRPRIVLATTNKFLPAEYTIDPAARLGDPDEIMARTQNVTVLNPYFELVPWEYVSAVITEEGPLEPARVLGQLATLATYPGLVGGQAASHG